jgi:ElaB/YqjD/DUF883 family membrane-anchored ribosome-binding protein
MNRSGRLVSAATVLLAALTLCRAGEDKSPPVTERVRETAEHVAEKVGAAATHVAEATKARVEKAVTATGKALDKAGEAIERTADKTGQAVERTAEKAKAKMAGKKPAASATTGAANGDTSQSSAAR